MRTNRFILWLCAAAIAASSCAPFYKCGEAKPENNYFLTKRAMLLLDERDSLCYALDARVTEIGQLNQNIDELNDDVARLQTSLRDVERRYKDLMGEKLSESEQFSLALQQKTQELNEKERLLAEREQALNDLRQVIARQDSITRRLNDVIRDALLGFQSDELSVDVKNGKVYVSMSDKLLFKSGSAAVEAKGKEALKVLAGVLEENRDIDILVEGHTDSIPIHTAKYADNWDLSVARATSIVRILTGEYRIEPNRLTASGKGEYSPKASNESPEGRAQNRRTEIILSPKLEEIMQLLKMDD
ncbi:OmpA family protein [Mangrovibacterium marinum]|uniref:Chemotaxis protein MotB n=1 Tax=Mangrovibacterium marinum TaxID=1639118 RepID=A0A2T5C3P2_9BACT|nr:OmpA family protein [Mangrovibacterium marinum]PTN09400.1 chemotaxis protein MotB [Mangrovibacterium marinum]